jgi:hypothetical protein
VTDRQTPGDWPPRRRAFERDLEPELRGEEREVLLELAARLTADRPVPGPGLRSSIRSRLLGADTTHASVRVGGLIFGYASSGALLLVVAAAGLVGIGPFAA